MSIWNGDASEFRDLANDLSRVGARAVPVIRQAMDASGEAFANEWRSNAAATSGEHGKHYPASISHELFPGVSRIGVDVGPDSSMPQGGMGPGFELGSRNQPPHLDGLKAMESVTPRAERMIDTALGHLFP